LTQTIDVLKQLKSACGLLHLGFRQ